MALEKEIKYSYNDISIVPAKISSIQHRSECNTLYEDNMLPLFTAPMTSVVDENNFQTFEDNKIHSILPRTCDLDTRIKFATEGKWSAFGLNEFEDIFIKNDVQSSNLKVLIDVANGHMSKIFDLVKQFKEKYQNIENKIMVGNIANPITYLDYAKVGADYIRCSIGTGSVCLTTSNTSVHYPMASLIDEIKRYKQMVSESDDFIFKSIPNIIADGGVRNYSDVIKALALGADYVMIGGAFAKMYESASIPFFICDGKKYSLKEFKNIVKSDENKWDVLNSEGNEVLYHNIVIQKENFGMASKEAQELMHGKKIHTSEGLSKTIIVEYTMKQWVDNFNDYLKSAMSYTSAKNLNTFKNCTRTIVVSNNTYQSVNK